MKLTNPGSRGFSKSPAATATARGSSSCTCSAGDKAYWVYRYRLGGREREFSIGPYPEVSLIEARAKHTELRKRVVVDKADPLAERRAARQAAAVAPTA